MMMSDDLCLELAKDYLAICDEFYDRDPSVYAKFLGGSDGLTIERTTQNGDTESCAWACMEVIYERSIEKNEAQKWAKIIYDSIEKMLLQVQIPG